VRFEVLTLLFLMMQDYWNMMQCHWMTSSQCFWRNAMPSCSWSSSLRRTWEPLFLGCSTPDDEGSSSATQETTHLVAQHHKPHCTCSSHHHTSCMPSDKLTSNVLEWKDKIIQHL